MTKRIRHHLSFVAVVVAATLTFAAHAQPAGQAELAPVGKVRNLEGDERNRAIAARDTADLRRAAHEKQYRAGPKYPKNDAECDADFAAVVAAYRVVSTQFPATEYDCNSRIRLAGAYQHRGEFEQAALEARHAAELFAGTELAPSANQAAGLICLQAIRDPIRAEPYFNRMRAEAGNCTDPQERTKWEAAATELISRCRRERRP